MYERENETHYVMTVSFKVISAFKNENFVSQPVLPPPQVWTNMRSESLGEI